MSSIFKNPWWLVFGSVIGLIVGNGPIVQFSFGVLLTPIANDLGWDRGTISSALVVSALATGLMTPLAGRLMDRYGIRPIALPAIVLLALSTAGMALFAVTPILFIVGYVIMGTVAAGQTPLPYAKSISATFDERRGLALGIAMAGPGLGAALVPQLTLWAIGEFGWRGAYVVLGLFTFALAFPTVALFMREPKGIGRSKGPVFQLEGATGSEALRDRRFWILSGAFIGVGLVANGTIAHVVPLLTDRGISAQAAAGTLTAAGLSLVAGRLIAGYLLDRIFAPYVAGAFFFAPVLGITFLLLAPDFTTAILGTVLVGIGLGAEVDLIAFLISRYLGNRSFGEIYGYIFLAFAIGSGIGPFVMGLAHAKLGSYTPALLTFEVISIISIALILGLGPYSYPPRNNTKPRVSN